MFEAILERRPTLFNSVEVIKDHDLLSPDCSIPRIDLIKFNKGETLKRKVNFNHQSLHE